MLMPASPEFVALCQLQVATLKQVMGAALSIVYLTQGLVEDNEPEFVPVAADPEIALSWEKEQVVQLLSQGLLFSPDHPEADLPQTDVSPGAGDALADSKTVRAPRSRLARSNLLTSTRVVEHPADSSAIDIAPTDSAPPLASAHLALSAVEQPAVNAAVVPSSTSPAQQMMIPLVHEGVVMGLLVTARVVPWVAQEQVQIERIARTLTTACVLDQRAQWAEQELQQYRLLDGQQHDSFDNLLHQFRNPLTALKTFGKLLMKRLLSSDPNHSVAEGIVRESDRLQELLRQFEAVVDLNPSPLLPGDTTSTWEAQVHPKTELPSSEPLPLPPSTHYLTGGRLALEWQPFAAILTPLLDSAQAIAQDRQLTLHVDLPPDLPPVQTDPEALKEVLNNLIDNALKYTPAGGTVRILAGLERATTTGKLQGLAVIDNGPGIPAADRVNLFQRHFRGVQATGDIPGSGLGLAIAHNLVQQMQGEIQLFSPAAASGWVEPDELPGTAFAVWLREA